MQNRNSGFTLIELSIGLCVVVFIGAFVLSLIGVFSGGKLSAEQRQVAKNNLDQYAALSDSKPISCSAADSDFNKFVGCSVSTPAGITALECDYLITPGEGGTCKPDLRVKTPTTYQ